MPFVKGQIPWNKGLRMPKEFGEKMSKALTGRKLSKEHLKNMYKPLGFEKGHIPWNKGRSKRMKKICLSCGKRFEVFYSFKNQRYCSNKCFRKDNSGKNHPNWKGGEITKLCGACGKEFKVQHSRGQKAKFCCHVCYAKNLKENPAGIIDNLKLGWGYNKGKKMSEKQKKKLSVIAKNRPAWVVRKTLMHRTPNKKEQILNRILKTNWPHEWKFVGDGRVVIEGKNPDFINTNGKKQIIELFGTYWHKESEVDERTNIFGKYGYKTLILWENELKNEQEVISKVLALNCTERP